MSDDVEVPDGGSSVNCVSESKEKDSSGNFEAAKLSKIVFLLTQVSQSMLLSFFLPLIPEISDYDHYPCRRERCCWVANRADRTYYTSEDSDESKAFVVPVVVVVLVILKAPAEPVPVIWFSDS